MFTIEYELQDGGPFYRKDFPSPEDYGHNMFFVRGTNDKGKTTMLNMIALGLYANKYPEAEKEMISDLLRAKMEYLSSAEIEHLKFAYNIVSLDGSTEISVQYDNGSLTTFLNNEPVGSEYLMESIQVLYDIPEDPLIKLQSSVRLIKENIMDYDRYLQRYRDDTSQKLTQIIDYNKKEENLRKNKKLLEDLERDLEIKAELEKNARKELTELEIVDKVFSFFEINDSIEENENKIVSLKEKRRLLKQKGIGGGTIKFKKQIDDFNNALSSVKEIVKSIKKYSNILSEEQNVLFKTIDKKITTLINPQELSSKNVETWNKEIKKIIVDLKNDPINQEFQTEEKQSELITKIMHVLNDYLTLEMNVPGTNIKNIFSFYRELDNYNKQIEPKISKKKQFIEVSKEIEKLSVRMSDLKVKRIEIPDIEEEQVDEYENIEKDIKKLKGENEKLVIQIAQYIPVVESLSEDETREILNNPGRRGHYKIKKEEFEGLKKQVEGLTQKTETYRALNKELAVLEEPPKYNEQWLRNEYDSCGKLLSKISKWKQVLEPINFRKKDIGVNYNQSKELFEALSEYFAEILQKVYFEKKSWEVTKVDLHNRQYIVKDRKPIKFIQMGTGHTALNSIMARIKQNFGGKKKVILIDEVGHMDEDNIQILVNEIKQQIKRNETLFALITIADSTVQDTTWEPIPI
jgi:hypothetical protein